MTTAGEILTRGKHAYSLREGRLPGDAYVVVLAIPTETRLEKLEDTVVEWALDIATMAIQDPQNLIGRIIGGTIVRPIAKPVYSAIGTVKSFAKAAWQNYEGSVDRSLQSGYRGFQP